MEKETIQQIIKSNDVLLASNSQLVKSNQETIKIIEELLIKNEAFVQLGSTIYGVLTIKNSKTWEEENWCKDLQKQLKGADKKDSDKLRRGRK